jgi:rhomboid protease GluP
MDPRRMCPHCRAFITIKDRVCPYCNERLEAKQSGDGNTLIAGLIPSVRFNIMIILLINFGIYLATAIFSYNSGHPNAFFDIDVPTLVMLGAKYNRFIAAGEWWRLLTAGFLHGGLMHIASNAMGLTILGPDVEETYGTARMLVIYFVATVVGFYASAVASSAVSVGASAAVFGLLGAMIADGVRRGHGINFRSGYVLWAAINLVIGFAPIAGINIDNAAHIGGLAAGFGVGYFAGTPGRVRSPIEYLWKFAAFLCVLITASCFLMMYLWFRRNVG